MPQLENALLAGHDVIFLGERGQAKTRMIRSLTGLLDEWMPIVAGSEINDDPYNPVSPHARDLVAEHGDDTPIEWVHRDDRFGEKLATPDTSIADLIGEVDPIKVAEGRYLSDELTLHYGLVPRTNRGIFAINELPDLAERIQVGLLNVLEERDVQIRGYKIRLPLDVHARRLGQPRGLHQPRPHHHAAEGPLRRQIRTHYPLDVETEVGDRRARRRGRSSPAGVHGARARVHGRDRRRRLSQLARQSPHVNQRSGVSVRLIVSQLRDARRQRRAPGAARRRARGRAPRVSDLEALAASTSGKIEIETLDEGREEQILEHLAARPRCSRCSRTASRPSSCATSIDAFDEGVVVHTGEDVASADYVAAARRACPRCARPCRQLTGGDESPAAVGQRRRVRARGPAPLEAPEQGRRRAPAPPTAAEAESPNGLSCPSSASLSPCRAAW